jgi:hypothetical protein
MIRVSFLNKLQADVSAISPYEIAIEIIGLKSYLSHRDGKSAETLMKNHLLTNLDFCIHLLITN